MTGKVINYSTSAVTIPDVKDIFLPKVMSLLIIKNVKSHLMMLSELVFSMTFLVFFYSLFLYLVSDLYSFITITSHA